MAASNLFKNESLSNVSGIINQAINDSNASIQPDSSNASDQNNELTNINDSLTIEMNNLSRKELKDNTRIDLNNQANATVHNPQMDYLLQNYLYDFRQLNDDSKSLASVQTSKSTRETIDFLSRFSPWGIFVLLCFLMIHFFCYIRDIEPLTQITEIIVICLAFVVFTLSSVFIIRIFCDSKSKSSQWTNNNLYSEEYIYTPNVCNDNVQEHSLNADNHFQATVNKSRTYLTAQTELDHDQVIRKQPHYYIEKNGNIYATQLAGLEFKNKIYSNSDHPPYQFGHNLPYINYLPASNAVQYSQQQLNQLNNQKNLNQFNQNLSHLSQQINQLTIPTNQVHCAGSIDQRTLYNDKRRDNLTKETAT